jgi:hypothetical protein
MTAKKLCKTETFIKPASLLLAAFITLSCATDSKAYKGIDLAVEQDNFQAAVEVIDKGQEKKRGIYPPKNAVMLFLDRGLIEHYAGNFESSSVDLQNAERLIEEAYTKSVSQGFSSYILNDNTKDYPGEDFEDIYINIFNALNYFNRGNVEGALVEIRKLSMQSGKLDMLSRKYEYTDPKSGAGIDEMVKKETGVNEVPKIKTSSFSNSALARFLSALFYQGEGNADSARIEFQQVHRAFEANNNVYRGPVPKAVDDAQKVPKGKARLNIISFTGLSPVKEEEKIEYSFPFFQHFALQLYVFKVPKLVKRSSLINRIEIVIDNGQKFDLELLEDIGSVIEETFAVRSSQIFLKTYIRAIFKYALADIAAIETARRQGELAGVLVAIAARKGLEATESADIRMSRYLPDKAYIGGIDLDPGTYSVIINYYNGSNVVAQNEFKDVEVKLDRLNLLESVKLK